MSYVVAVAAASDIGGNEGTSSEWDGRTDGRRVLKTLSGQEKAGGEGKRAGKRWDGGRRRDRERERGKKNHDPGPSTSKKVLLEVTCCDGDSGSGDEDDTRPWEVLSDTLLARVL